MIEVIATCIDDAVKIEKYGGCGWRSGKVSGVHGFGC